MKKLFTYTFLMLLFCLPSNVEAQQILLRIPDSTVVQNDVFNLPVFVDSSLTGKNVTSYQLQISFNSSRLVCDSLILDGTLTQSASFTASFNNSVPGIVNIAAAGSNTLSGTGVLLYLRFKALQTGYTYVDFTDEENNFFNEGEPTIIFQRGRINITALPTITISPNDRLLTVGENLQFTVSGGEVPYQWFVTNIDVADINPSGWLTAISRGFTKVVVQDNAGLVDTTDNWIEIRALKLSTPDTTVYPNTTFNLPIYVTDITDLGIISGNFTLEYNSDNVSAIDVVQTGTMLSSFANLTHTISYRKIEVAFAGTTPLSGSGILLYIKVHVSQGSGGITNIDLSNIIFNEDILANYTRGYVRRKTIPSLNISPSSGITLLVGETRLFSASGGKPPYHFSTTDTNIATIDSLSGLLLAINGGTVRVTVTDSILNEVTTSDIEIYDMEVSIQNASVVIGNTFCLPVYIDNIPPEKPISSFEFQLSYANTFFEPIGFRTIGTLTEGWAIAFNYTNNAINIAGASSSSFGIGNVVIKIILKVLPTVNPGQYLNVSFANLTFNEGIPRPLPTGGRITAIEGFVDDNPPVFVQHPDVVSLSTSSAVIHFITDKLSNTEIYYNTELLFDQGIYLEELDAALVTNHVVKLTGLQPDTKYKFFARAYDIKCNGSVSIISSFITLDQPDRKPPVITTGPFASYLEDDKAMIWWKTDKISSSRVDYGVDPDNLDSYEKADEIFGVILHQLELTGLQSETTYHYRVSSAAENDSVVVSGISKFTTLAVPDTIPPRITTGPDPTSIQNKSVTIEWITDELSTSIVEYGLSELLQPTYSDTVSVDADTSGVIHHQAVLTGLIPKKVYNYRVISRDLSAQLNEVTSRNKRFATAAVQDNTPPVLITGPIVDWTDKSATFEWETDELSDSFVHIRKKNTADNFRTIGDVKKVTKHIITVTNLEPAQEYEYEIASRDLTGNLVTWPTSNGGGTLLKFIELRKVAQPPGGGGTFETDQEPDTQQPIIIEGPAVVAKTANTITVQWKTDERSNSFVDYGFTPAYGSVKGDAADVTEHSITLTNLMASTVYNFKVNSTDIDNNGPAFSGNAAVTTDAEADQTPPKITAGPIVESITDDQATIIWETDELSDTYIEFGTTTDYGLVRISTEDVIVHSITLTNLLSDTTYHFRVSSTDISDNGPTTSADTTFTTAAAPDETPPVISNVLYSAVTDKTATITFTTDELGDTFVDYGIISTTEFKVGNAQDVFEHEITLTNLLPDTTYRFEVGSIDKSDNEDTLDVDFTFKTAAAPDTAAPAAPSGFTGEEGNTQVLLIWNPNTEEDLAGYNIYRKVGVDTTLIATLVADTFYQDDGLTNGEVYGYFISASDNRTPYNESSSTSIVNLTPDEAKSPSIPAQFLPEEGQRIRYNEINLTVENSTPPEGRSLTYEFVIAEEPDFFNQVAFGENVAEGSTYTTWYSGLELTHDQTYHWKSRAFDGYFYSVWSGARSFIADTTGTTNVTLVEFWGEDNEGVVALGWETSRETNNAGFNIYRSLNENEGFEKINENLISCKDNAYNYTDTDVETGRTYYYRLESVSSIGFAEKLGTVAVEVTAPRTFKLYQNYPNPFNPVTTIKFDLPRPERVRIKIYNILGQEVKELFDEPKKAGYHVEQWDGTDKLGRPVASGLYIYRIIAGEFVRAKKMVLIR